MSRDRVVAIICCWLVWALTALTLLVDGHPLAALGLVLAGVSVTALASR